MRPKSIQWSRFSINMPGPDIHARLTYVNSRRYLRINAHRRIHLIVSTEGYQTRLALHNPRAQCNLDLVSLALVDTTLGVRQGTAAKEQQVSYLLSENWPLQLFCSA